MTIQKIGALTMILGSIVFGVGIGLPVSIAVFMTSNATERITTISASLTQWNLSQVVTGLGSCIAALGFVIFAFAFRDRSTAPLLLLAGVGLAIGAFLWSIHLYQRAVNPQAFVSGTLPAWLYTAYSILTLGGILLLGVSALNLSLPTWFGWLLIIIPVILAISYLILKDMPPFIYYILILITGIVLASLG